MYYTFVITIVKMLFLSVLSVAIIFTIVVVVTTIVCIMTITVIVKAVVITAIIITFFKPCIVRRRSIVRTVA